MPIFCPTDKPELEVAGGTDVVVAVGKGVEELLATKPVTLLPEIEIATLPLCETKDDVVDGVGVEVSECSDAYAETSIQVTLKPTAVGKDMMSVSLDASAKATVREVEGHQQGEGTETVPPVSSQATHSFEVPLQYTRPAQV